MFKRLFRKILPSPDVKEPNTSGEATFGTLDGMNHEERVFAQNQEAIARANLKMQHEVAQKNLQYMYRTVIIAFVAVLVAIGVGVFAIKNKPVVTVKPNITVQAK